MAAPLNRVEAALRRIVLDLSELQASVALVGGLAVSARSEPRFTRDVDLAIAVNDDRAAERLVAALTARGWRTSAVVEQDATKRLAATRLVPPGEESAGVVVDLLFASSGIEPDLVARAEKMEVFAGLAVAVARVPDLIALKVLSRDDRRRPQDAVDLRSLLAIATREQVDDARRTLDSIAERGFGRNRDLGKALQEAVDAFGGGRTKP